MENQTLEFKVERIHKLDGNGATKAFCDISIANTFLIKGLRIVSGKEGLFVSMPSEQGKDGKWYDTVHPLSRSVRQQLEDIVLSAYEDRENDSEF